MKISQIPSIAQSAETNAIKAESVRSVKMNVNRTPGLVPQQSAEELIIPGTSEEQTTTTAVSEATEPLSPQLAALAKQRRAFQLERKAYLDEKRAFDESRSQGGDFVSKADLLSRPIEVLLEQGVTYEQLTEAVLKGQEGSELRSLKDKIAALEKGVDQKLTDRDTQIRQQTVLEIKRNAEQLVSTSDEFELIRETRAVPDVVRLIENTYDESGELMDVQEACKLIEDELFKRHQNLVKLKKMQGLIAPAQQPIAQQRNNTMRTLTNKDNASIPLGRKERALQAALGMKR